MMTSVRSRPRRTASAPTLRTPVAAGLALLVLAGIAACSGGGLPDTAAADLILLNGNIITVDAEGRVAQAVAVRDQRIVAVGSNAEAEALAGARTQRIDLRGLTATPGLLDAHAHFSGGGADRLYILDLSYPNVKSIADVVRLVKERLGEMRPGEWLQGQGWDEGKFEELRYILAADLDSVSPDNPVWLRHTMGHYGTANSLALKLAGVTGATPDPAGGTIDHGPDGSPTGVLKESAQGLVSRLIPPLSREQRREGIRQLARAFNEEGMTGLKDPGIGPETWDDYQTVMAEDDLSVRVFALWRTGRDVESARATLERIAPFTKPYRSTGDDHVISGGVKLYIDGSGGARTAWLWNDWNRESTGVDTGNAGYPTTDPDVLRRQIRLFHDAGIHISVHSIGDRAIDWTVDSYAEALAATPTPGLRHGIIHANIPTDHALDVMADLQKRYDAAYPEPSATFMWWIGDTYAGNFGPERAKRLNPFRSYLDRGMRWANGSDFYVTPFPARYGIWASVARQTLLGVYGANPWGMDQAVDVRTALRAQTIWAARQMFMERKIGSIEVGKYADIAIWDRDLYTVPTPDLEDLECQMTIFAGRVVFTRPGAAVTVTGGT